jgi:hypothetical protein
LAVFVGFGDVHVKAVFVELAGQVLKLPFVSGVSDTPSPPADEPQTRPGLFVFPKV